MIDLGVELDGFGDDDDADKRRVVCGYAPGGLVEPRPVAVGGAGGGGGGYAGGYVRQRYQPAAAAAGCGAGGGGVAGPGFTFSDKSSFSLSVSHAPMMVPLADLQRQGFQIDQAAFDAAMQRSKRSRKP